MNEPLFPPIPSVTEMESDGGAALSQVPTGRLYGVLGDPDLLPKAQLLYLTLWENGIGRELAADHDVEMVESADDVLRFHGSRDQECAWLLDCWRHETLRPFFDALDLKVKE